MQVLLKSVHARNGRFASKLRPILRSGAYLDAATLPMQVLRIGLVEPFRSL